MNPNNEQLDQDVVNLAKAIRQSESGGNFNARGKSQEIGAYQFTPDTWSASSMKYLGQPIPLDKATPEQQNEVAYKQIKEWKDSGKNPGQIASMWNAGAGEPDAYTGKFSNGRPAKGTNKFGAAYDVPAYAKSVAETYQKIKGGGQGGIDPRNPSAVNTNTQAPQAQQTQQDAPQQDRKGLLGTIADKIAQPFINLAAIPVQAGVAGYNKLTGSNIADPYQNMPGLFGKGKTEVSELGDIKGKGKSALTVGTEVAMASGAGGLLGSVRGGSALASPTVGNAMSKFKMPMKEFQALSNAEKVNALTESLATADAASKPIIQKAISEAMSALMKQNGIGSFAELNPGLAKALGLGAKALSSLTKLGLGYLGYRGLSDVVRK